MISVRNTRRNNNDNNININIKNCDFVKVSSLIAGKRPTHCFLCQFICFVSYIACAFAV